MCLPEANIGKPPRPEFAIQLAEAREEWMRRKARRKILTIEVTLWGGLQLWLY
jgi:uncharacterized membrane protein